jgi:hypothetical protein
LFGGAIASFIPTHPALAVVAGFASHFAIDAIPHWDYPLRSIAMGTGADNRGLRISRGVLIDLLKIGVDACVGLALALWLFATPASMIVVGLSAYAAMLPAFAVRSQSHAAGAANNPSAVSRLDPFQTQAGLEAGYQFTDRVCRCGVSAGHCREVTQNPM